MTEKKELKPGWRWVKFGDVVRQVKDKVDPKEEGTDRYVAGEHMDTDDLRIRRWGEITDDYLGPAFHMRFQPGQVLYGSRRAYLRKIAVPDFEGVCANTTFVLESADEEVLLPDLLPFIMSTETFHQHSIEQSKGSINPYVNFSDLAWYEFPLPPLSEQAQIAERLQAIEEAIDSLRELELQIERLRKSLTIDFFSRILEAEETKVVEVAKAGDVEMGRQRSPKYDKGTAPRPYLRVANVYDGYIDTEDVKSMGFSDEEFEKYRLEPGDVLLVEGHSSAKVVGRSTIVRNEVPNACFQNTLLRFRARSTTPEYAHQFFRYCLYSGRFTLVAKQTTIAHLGKTRFAKMQFPIPGPAQEKEAVFTLRHVERSLEQVVHRRQQIEEVKRAELQALTESTILSPAVVLASSV